MRQAAMLRVNNGYQMEMDEDYDDYAKQMHVSDNFFVEDDDDDSAHGDQQ
jgi:hypothetical protein